MLLISWPNRAASKGAGLRPTFMRTPNFKPATSTLSAIVEDYRQNHRHRNTREKRWFRLQPSFQDAIRHAGRAEGPGGRRLSHQRRLSKETLRRCEATLLAAEKQLAAAGTFADLHSLVESLIRSIRGVGELMVYDASVRLAAHLGLEPKEIYLHAGTRQGAAALGLDARVRRISRAQLPTALRRLPATEFEDILCIYKDALQGMGKLPAHSSQC